MNAQAPAPGTALAPVLPGIVLGAALQLQQPALWTMPRYIAGVLVAALALLLAAAWRPTAGRARAARWTARSALLRLLALLLASAALSACLAGWRAAAYLADALDPALEGQDVRITGLVAAMPHRNEAGIRFRFEVEQARLNGRPVRLPSDVLLGWYAGDGLPPADLRPGERWEFTVRPKAPHGQVNPHGFDYELWLWEQGLQATGYVRTGARDPPPRRLEATWRKPLELLRHRVRDAIYAQVPDPRLAGVIAALVVGDQGAIERSDWDVFRATGVAHLMSNKRLAKHNTLNQANSWADLGLPPGGKPWGCNVGLPWPSTAVA